MNLDFYREIHEKEFRRKDALAQRATSIITGLTTLGGFVAFIVINYKPTGHLIDVSFWLLAITSIVCIFIASFWLIQSYRVPMLQDIAKPAEWIFYWQKLLAKYKNNQGKFASAEEEFTDHLITLYADVAGENINANDKRGSCLVKSNNALIFTFTLLITTSIVFYYNNYILLNDPRIKGGNQVFSAEETLICVPAVHMPNFCDGPGKRPVPDPSPPKQTPEKNKGG